MPKHPFHFWSLIIASLIFLLALALSACAPLSATESNLPIGQVTILKNGTKFASLQATAIGSAEVKAAFKKKGGTAEDHVYQATELSEVLTAAGISELPAGSKVVITAKDGFAATFTADEIQQAAAIYLASQIDQQPIAGSDGKPAVMIVVPGDAFSNRWVSDVLSIDLISG